MYSKIKWALAIPLVDLPYLTSFMPSYRLQCLETPVARIWIHTSGNDGHRHAPTSIMFSWACRCCHFLSPCWCFCHRKGQEEDSPCPHLSCFLGLVVVVIFSLPVGVFAIRKGKRRMAPATLWGRGIYFSNSLQGAFIFAGNLGRGLQSCGDAGSSFFKIITILKG